MSAARRMWVGLGMLMRTAVLSWLVTVLTLGVFLVWFVPAQHQGYRDVLEAKARALAVVLEGLLRSQTPQDDDPLTNQGGLAWLGEDASIRFLVLTREDGRSRVYERGTSYEAQLGEDWRPPSRVVHRGIGRMSSIPGRVFHLAQPIEHAGRPWGWVHVGLGLEGYRKGVWALYTRTLALALACIGAGLAVSLFYARRLAQPIQMLREAVQQVAEGNLSVRAVSVGPDEIGELASSFNQMTDSLLQRDRILQSVRFAAQQFLASDDWRRTLDQVLSSIGQAANSSRVCVWRNRTAADGTVALGQWTEWRMPGVPPADEHGGWLDQPWSGGGLEAWATTLSQGQALTVDAGLSPDARKRFLEPLGTRSMLAVPVVVSGRWWGAIAVHENRYPRDWSEAEIDSLRAAADTLGAAIERQQAKEALVAAKNVAEAANQAKSQFLANMSHEIRTPITGVMGMLHLLGRTPLSAKQSHCLANAVVSAQTLLTVIGDVLDFSKIEAGRLELVEAEFSVPDVIDEALRLFAEKAERKGVELVGRVADPVPREVVGDAHRLRQVLVNLVGNALKFTDRGEIVVSASAQPLRSGAVELRFEVRDTGCGISQDQQRTIFDAFAQGDGSMARAHGGTGLGLAISRQLCGLMGGGIDVESELGKGSRFRFTVTVRAVADPAGKDVERVSRLDLRGLRVLVVDDCAVTREVVREYVRIWKGEAEEAADGTAALQALRASAQAGRPFGVAVLDWRMPGLDGVALARLIREDEVLRETGLVLLSSFAELGDGGEAAEVGFAAVVPKPARKSELYNALMVAANQGVRGPGARPAERKLPATPAPVTVGGARILLAEDNEINQEVAREMLAELGYVCRCVRTGREAVAAVEQGGVDLVLMDCQMPEMDGYEATRRIRERERGRDPQGLATRLPIVALTAHAMSGDRERCLGAGMDDYLTKPLDPEALARTLAVWLRQTAPEGTVCAGGNTNDGGMGLRQWVNYGALLRRCMGKQELADRLLGKFVEQAEGDLREVEQAVSVGDALAVVATAHRLKGAAANVSVEVLRQTADHLEAIGRRGALGEARAEIARLRQGLTALRGGMSRAVTSTIGSG